MNSGEMDIDSGAIQKEVMSGDDKRPPPARHSGAKPERDLWDYISILGRPVAALVTALAVGAIGWFGNDTLADREEAITKRTQLEQNYRLYTELISQREQADSALRKDMFTEILTRFFTEPESTGDPEDTSKSLLKLEMLALNFGESLSLSPLFRELDRDIRSKTAGPWRDIERPEHLRRLHSLAKRVSDSQVATLGVGGFVFDFEVPISRATRDSVFTWPDAWSNLSEDERQARIGRQMDFIQSGSDSPADEDAETVAEYEAKEQTQFDEGWYEVELGDVSRQYQIHFANARPDTKTIEVEIQILEVSSASDDRTSNLDDKVVRFELSYFDFPLIDNIRLSNDQRFALVMRNFDENFVELAGVSFPGIYASQRDKPFLDEVIDDMRRRSTALSAQSAQ